MSRNQAMDLMLLACRLLTHLLTIVRVRPYPNILRSEMDSVMVARLRWTRSDGEA